MTAPRDDVAWAEAVRRAVEASCVAQGVPVHVEDEAVLDHVARVVDRCVPLSGAEVS
jgi:hypothetical protein